MAVASLRVRLIILFFLSVVPVLALILMTNIEQRELAEKDVKEDALSLIQLTTSQHEHFIKGARQLLIALAQLPSVRSRDAAACSPLFTDLFKRYPFYTILGVADLDGNIFCSPFRSTRPVNIVDRAYFQGALNSRDFSIGDYAIGRRTGKASMHFGYPVLDRNDNVQGVVFVALDLMWFKELAARMHLAPGTTLTLFDRNGTILMRYPSSEQWMVGTSAVSVPLFKTIHAQQGDGIVEAEDLDGVMSLFAFAPIGRSEEAAAGDIAVFLAVGIPTATAFAEVNYIFVRNLFIFGTIALLALATAWWLGSRFMLRPVRALLQATERLQGGDLSARTELPLRQGEHGQLANAFDHMAERLQQREEQLQHSLTEATELKNLLDSIFASIASGVITTDLQGRITLINAAALRILGYNKDTELVEQNVANLLPPLGTTLLPYVYRVGQSGEPVVGLETSINILQHGMVYLRFNLSILKGHEQTPGIAIVVDDVTDKRRMEARGRLLEQMVSPGILNQLDPERLQLGGSRTEVTVLFADIHGFTSISEQLNPEDLIGLLNRYLAAMANAVLAEEGTIDKFLGDAVMAWFNAPLPQPDHVLRGIRAALRIRDAISALHKEVSPLFHLSVGIGLHVGDAVLGMVGTQERMEYTAIGDNVNIAKRIQENTDAGEILISSAVYASVKEYVHVRPVAAIQAKGKQKPLEVYELLGLR
ncbi:adenylate/guanylate cyclase domain-containing protein [Amphritea sp. HPY]|uniref:adenylate/guanylate cyclase domain-containing protein n=1 Tax=Amphritea sp. HPY TaxID=3421652 RepID=UPI003D7ED373